MSVVPVSHGTGDEDGPLLGGGDSEEGEQKSDELHFGFLRRNNINDPENITFGENGQV